MNAVDRARALDDIDTALDNVLAPVVEKHVTEGMSRAAAVAKALRGHPAIYAAYNKARAALGA